MKKLWLYLLLIGVGYWLWQGGFLRSPSSQSALQQTAAPIQQSTSTASQSFKNYTLTDLESYSGEFRILGRENYHFGREADLSPMDLAVGWGSMADPQVYNKINISQRNRWYYWQTNEMPIARHAIESQSANMHIIPANDYIADQLKKIKVHDVVYLQGALVEVKAEDGWHWRSSLSREDTGDGACELMRVDAIRFIQK